MFHCTQCNIEIDKSSFDSDDWVFVGTIIVYNQKCSCGGEIKAGYPKSNRIKYNGSFYHESRSMGCSPKQVEAMQKAYPGSEYKKKGKSYVLVTRSAGEMDRRLAERGMVNYTKNDM